jgi:hypothetical protein
VEFTGSVAYGTAAEESAGLQARQPSLQTFQRITSGGAELAGELGWDLSVLHPDLEQGRVFDHEAAEHAHPGFHEIRARIVRSREGIHGRGEQVEGSGAQGDDEGALRPEDAVDGPRRGTDVVGEAPYGQGTDPVAFHNPLGGVEEGDSGSRVVLFGPSHP